jgi:hypothetical protein
MIEIVRALKFFTYFLSLRQRCSCLFSYLPRASPSTSRNSIYSRISYACTFRVFETGSLHVPSFDSSMATLAWPTIDPNELPYFFLGVSQPQLYAT